MHKKYISQKAKNKKKFKEKKKYDFLLSTKALGGFEPGISGSQSQYFNHWDI